MNLLQQYLENTYPDKEKTEKIRITKTLLKDIYGTTKLTEKDKELDLSDFVNLEELDISDSGDFLSKVILGNKPKLEELILKGTKIKELDLSNCPSLKTLIFAQKLFSVHGERGVLTSTSQRPLEIDFSFLTELPNPEKLETLDIKNNGLAQPTNIEIFSKFVNLETLKIENVNPYLTLQIDRRSNKFYGSLKALKNLTKLKELNIKNTDIDSGVECLSDSLVDALKNLDPPLKKATFVCSSNEKPQSKCKVIYEGWEKAEFDLEVFRLEARIKNLEDALTKKDGILDIKADQALQVVYQELITQRLKLKSEAKKLQELELTTKTITL